MLPTDAALALTFFGVIQQYEWRHVAFIIQNENLYTVVSFGQILNDDTALSDSSVSSLSSPPLPSLLSQTVERLEALLQSIGVTYSESVFESDEGIAGLGPEPFDPEARIFVIAAFSNHARALMCEVGGAGGLLQFSFFRWPGLLWL